MWMCQNLHYPQETRIPKHKVSIYILTTAYFYGLKITRIRNSILKQLEKDSFTSEENIHMYTPMKNTKLFTLLLMC